MCNVTISPYDASWQFVKAEKDPSKQQKENINSPLSPNPWTRQSWWPNWVAGTQWAFKKCIESDKNVTINLNSWNIKCASVCVTILGLLPSLIKYEDWRHEQETQGRRSDNWIIICVNQPTFLWLDYFLRLSGCGGASRPRQQMADGFWLSSAAARCGLLSVPNHCQSNFLPISNFCEL